jgi:hypothetical protein
MGYYELLVLLAFFVVGFAGTGFWVWALIDCVRNEPEGSQEKLVWVIIIVFTNVIGAAMYLFIQRPKRRGSTGR